MRVGVFYFPTDYCIAIGELAHALEERGFASLFVPEHTHIPTSRRSPFPAGGELPKKYSHTHDPFVGLSFAAAATKKLLLGTGICLIPERDPIVTAKCIASLDQLSGGRFIFGIGGGWNVEEMENHGARYNTRFKLMRERILAMKALWTQEEAAFHGEFEFRSGLVLAQAGTAPTSADLVGRRDRLYFKAHHRILRRLDPAPGCRLHPQGRSRPLAPDGRSGGAEPRVAVDHRISRTGRQGCPRRIRGGR